jgi:hypothetical protein
VFLALVGRVLQIQLAELLSPMQVAVAVAVLPLVLAVQVVAAAAAPHQIGVALLEQQTLAVAVAA